MLRVIFVHAVLLLLTQSVPLYRKEGRLNTEVGPWKTWGRNGMEGKQRELTPSAEAPAEADTGKVFVQDVNGSTPTGWMQLGTPPKKLLVIFDTGSDKLVAKTWDTLAAELDSIDQGVKGMILPSDLIYNHDKSSTYARRYMTDPQTNKSVPAKNEIAYGSGVAITDEGNDTVLIGHFKLENFSLSEITQDSLQLLHTKKGISGVLGLQHMKNRSLGRSLFSRMRDAGVLTAFGYCRGAGDNGSFLWGDTSTEGDEIPVVGDMHWAVHVGAIKVNGNGSAHVAARPAGNGTDIIIKVEPNSSGFIDAKDGDPNTTTADAAEKIKAKFGSDEVLTGNTTLPCAGDTCCGILDTGSNIIAGPTKVMKAISDQVNVASDCSNYDTLPTISLSFGGKNVTIHPEGYVMKVPMPSWAKLGGADEAGGGELEDADENGGDADGAGFDQGDDQGELRDRMAAAAGLEQQGLRQRSHLGWKAVFAHLKKHRGIDLAPALRDALDSQNASDPAEFMCMPALVPLDKHTKYGPLYIVGTPLLQTYYARWSFKSGDDSPKIYIKNLTEANTCKNLVATPANSSASLEAVGPVTVPLIRSEHRSPLQRDVHQRRGPMIRNIEDISFPHWARHLDVL